MALFTVWMVGMKQCHDTIVKTLVMDWLTAQMVEMNQCHDTI